MANKVTWTVLPNGVTGGRAKFSLFISLTLETYVNWAQIVRDSVNGLTLVFTDESGGVAQATVNFTPSKVLVSPSLWTQTFPVTVMLGGTASAPSMGTPIRTPVYQRYSARRVISYPTKAIRERAETIYGFSGLTPPGSTIPGATCLGRPLVAVAGGEGEPNSSYPSVERPGSTDRQNTITDLRSIATILETRNDSNQSVFDQTGPGFLDEFGDPYLHLIRFYRRGLNRMQMAPPETPQPAPPPTIGNGDVQNEDPDLHQVLASLGDHPALLRRFGLVLDAELTLSQSLTALIRDRNKVRLDATGLPSGFTHERPHTLYTDEITFLPAASSGFPSDVEDGLLKVGGADYELQTFDIDSAGLKLIGQAAGHTFFLPPEGTPGSNPNPQGTDIGQELANLRTVGYAVARNDRGTRVGARFARSDGMQDARTADSTLDNLTLAADDVLRGYRVDVLHESDPQNSGWRSLSKRHGAYFLGDDRVRVPGNGEIHDEGYVKSTSSATDAVETPGQSLSASHAYVHESTFEWSGWSLVIPPPGRLHVFDSTTNEDVVVDPNTQEQITTLKVDPRFKVEPHTLPKLRFGEAYRLRARAVDLAGNSLPLETATTNDTLRTPSRVFRRYEPVPQPNLVLRRAIVEGESLETIVIRSKSGRGNIPGNVFFSTNDRHVAPPSTNLDLVIRHGMLDPFFDDPTRSFNVAAKVDGTLLDREIIDIRTGRRVQVNGIRILTGVGSNATPGQFPPERGVSLRPGEYLVHTEEQLRLPYLPDPLAVGFTVADIDHLVNEPIVGLRQVFFRGNWPEVEPAKLIVRATNDDDASMDVQGGNLLIRLPPATILDLRYSSTMRVEDITEMAIWHLTMSSLFPSQYPDSLDDDHPTVNATNLGLNWLIQGRKPLKLVHAVERPLEAATIPTISVTPERELGETFALLGATVVAHSRSTGSLDLRASWTDPVDRLTDPAPTEEEQTGHVLNTKIEYTESEVILDNENTNRFENPFDHRPKQEFGDTKHRFVNYRADSTTRYREYFPASVTSVLENITLPGVPTQVNVLSSARPAMPEVLYIVPTFRWDDGDGDDDHGGHGRGPRGRRHRPRPPGNITSRRLGRGLRVYLARPWYSSGVGERLGVVIPRDAARSEEIVTDPSGNLQFSDPTRQFISVWGADPIWDNLPPVGGVQTNVTPNTPLTTGDFANAADFTTTPVSIPELEQLDDDGIPVPDNPPGDGLIEDRLVHVVAFDVEFNHDRRVWFSDIEMTQAPSQTPFVHLALVRYQKDSIANAFVSGVVRAEFIQLMNDRAATLAVQRQTIQVSLLGIASHNRFGDDSAALLTPPTTPPEPPPGFVFDQAAGAGRIVVAHVERRDADEGDFGWERVGDEVVLPSFRAEDATEDDFEVLWSGSVARPRRSGGLRHHRLVLREIEVFYTDEDVAETLTVPTPTGRFVRGRVIYLDTIPLRDIEW